MQTGIVLSGGGARGIAHLGVLAALDELEIRISALSGTSAGAIAAALYGGGMQPVAIKELIKHSAYFGLSHFHLSKPGLFDMEALRELLVRHLSYSCFEDLPVRLFITATNLTKGCPETFSAGPLVEPILASACIPVLFNPVSYKGAEYADGGILNNFPVEALAGHCDFIIGSHVNRSAELLSSPHPWHKADILDRCFHLAIARSVYEKAGRCHIFLDHPGIAGIGMFETKKADELFDIGYRECMRHRNELLPLQIKKTTMCPEAD